MKPRAALAALCGLAGLALAAGCGDHTGSPVGFGDTTPSGGTYLVLDVQPVDAFDPSIPGDTFDSSQVVCRAHVFDASSADGFRLYVDPANAGYRPATDYVAEPVNSYSTGFEIYALEAEAFDPTVRNEFVAHGARGGLETRVTAVSEHAITPAVGGLTLARQSDVPLIRPIRTAVVDTVPRLAWQPVAGAARYVVQIFGPTGLQYMAVVPDSGHKVESQPAIFLQHIPLRANFFFTWRVMALDAGNRIIGQTRTPEGFITRRR